MPPPSSFLQIFAKSPIEPVEQHIDIVYECCSTLIPFFEAVFVNDADEVVRLHDSIAALESDADQLCIEVRKSVPRGIFLPVERRDLLTLLQHQDQMANRAELVSSLAAERQLRLPETLHAVFREYVKCSLDVMVQARASIKELPELLNTGFAGNEARLVENMVADLAKAKDDSQDLQSELRQQIFAIETTMSPIDAMFLYRIVEHMGELARQADAAGTTIQLMLFK